MAYAKMKKLGASFSTGKISPIHNFRTGDIPNNVDRGRIKDNVVLIDNLKGRTIEEFTNDEMRPYIKEHDARQKRKDRRIYVPYVNWHMSNGRFTQNKESKEDVKLAYEAVLCYGNNEDLWKEYFNTETSEERKREMYDEAIGYYKNVVDEFMERYKHLRIVYAVIHADEPNGSIHCHLCFQPRAEYTRGLGVQVCISKALEQDGIEKVKERMDAKEEGYQLTRLYKEFRHQVMNRQMKELGYEIIEEIHGREHISSNIFVEKMKEIDEREKKIREVELFVEDVLDIEAEERKRIIDDSEGIIYVPEKKNMFGKVVEKEKVIMDREIYDSKMVNVNIQRERDIIERTTKKITKKFQNIIENNLSGIDKELMEENEKLRNNNMQQEIKIRSLDIELRKQLQLVDKLEYILESIKNFIKSQGMEQRLTQWMKTFQEYKIERIR